MSGIGGERRIFGIETEYGVMVDGDFDPVLESVSIVRSYLHSSPRWDYSLEDPRMDMRGFRAPELLEPPDEKEQKGKGYRSYEEIRSDIVLHNGARFYNDHTHPEFSTPECSSLVDIVRYDKAGERILLLCRRKREEERGSRVYIYKNNTDFHGHSYGCHENYLVRRDLPFDQLVQGLIPFFVTRQIFCGAGKVGSEIKEEGVNVRYQLSQRAEFFTKEMSVDTMHQRPIINTRDEPHADPARYRRLHVIVGDSNMSEYATALKVGTTSLVLDMIEEGGWGEWIVLEDPVRAIKEISRDEGMRWEVRLGDGRVSNAVDIQRMYWEECRRRYEGRDEETDWVLREWGGVLECLGEGRVWDLVDRVDWVAKRWLIERFMEEEGVEWGDPWLQSIDLEYHNIDPESGLYYCLERMGYVRRVVRDEDIEKAISEPPANTRAKARAEAMKILHEKRIKCIVDWDSIYLENRGHIDMKDPYDTYSTLISYLKGLKGNSRP
jgi:proteasome accessory factor A